MADPLLEEAKRLLTSLPPHSPLLITTNAWVEAAQPAMVELVERVERAEATNTRLARVIPSLISFALSAPTSRPSKSARDLAVERALEALPAQPDQGATS